MLSKPSATSSAGSSSAASKSTASRSRTAFAYSLRLRRCSTTLVAQVAPGSAARSSESSSHATSESTAAGVGLPRARAAASRGRAACAPPSRTGRRAARCSAAVRPSKLTPAILARSLWQPAQYCLTVASCASAAGAVAAARAVRDTGATCAAATTPGSAMHDQRGQRQITTVDASRMSSSCLSIRRQVGPQALERAAHELVAGCPSARRIPWSAWPRPLRPARVPCSASSTADRRSSRTSRPGP